MNTQDVKTHRRNGTIGEDIAVRYLTDNGYEIVERNYYYNHGEIDIIAKEQDTLVFVEVKSRRSTIYGEPEESVTPRKQELIRRTAEGYVLEKNMNNVNCRFDVVAVYLKEAAAECTILKNCF